jgi:hypothetical protein
LKQRRYTAQSWTPTRGADLNSSEQLVATALTAAGIDWAYEDRFLPTSENDGVLHGICPDYRIKAGGQWPEQYLEVTTARQVTAKRRKARLAERLHGTAVTVIDRVGLERIAADSQQILSFLQPA